MVQPLWKPPTYDSDDPEADADSDDGPEYVENSKKCPLWSKICDNLTSLLVVIYDRVPWGHILPVIFLILFTTFGGWLFRYLETGIANGGSSGNGSPVGIFPGDANSSYMDRKAIKKRMMGYLISIGMNRSISIRHKEKLGEEAWEWYEKNSNGLCDSEEDVDSKWSMWNAMFYAATLYTTIGYGNIAPSTTAGRIATMLYALVGIPLVLTILNSWGSLLFQGFKRISSVYLKIKHRRSIWVPMAEVPDGIDELPVFLAVFLLIFWIGTCAAVFLIWEDDWNYFTALYFFFISLTTIGLGDVVPRYPKYTLMCFALVLCGLSVVSMSLNIIQTKIEAVFKSMMMGIEQEYWQRQVEPGTSRFGEEGMNASVGVMQLWKKKPLRERLLFRLMDKSKKEMLHAYWEKKANTKNESTQTIIKQYVTESLQVDMEEEELLTKYKNRKYVYNLHD